MPTIIACILIGAVVGTVAGFLYPGPKKPRSFALTIVLGIAGAGLATSFVHIVGLVKTNRLADPISMVVGAIIVLFIWNRLVAYVRG